MASVLRFGREIEATILLSETFGVENALLPHPANAAHAQRDNVNGQPRGLGMEALTEVAERASALSSPSVTTTMRPSLLR